MAQAEAEARNAEAALTRSRDLQKSGFVSQAAVDTADTQHKAAQAGLAQARAARVQATVAQGYAELSAPFDAVVLATHVEAGDLALPGRALVTLYEPGRMRAVVQVPASRATAVGAARDVQVQLPDGRTLRPVVRELLPAADPVSQTVEWRLDLPAEANTSRPGPDDPRDRLRHAGPGRCRDASPEHPRRGRAAPRRSDRRLRGPGRRLRAARRARWGRQPPAGVDVLAGLTRR